MAITLKAKPETLTPAYNEVMWIFDSTNKTKQGFRYVFDIYRSGTTEKVGEYRIIPRLNDGYGEIDLSRLLRTYVQNSFNPTLNGATGVPNIFYFYQVNVGEEFVVDYTLSTPQNNGGFLRINTTPNHTFVAGDSVAITGANITGVNGVYNVVSVQSTSSITISLPWQSGFASLTTAIMRYADNRKTITRDLSVNAGNRVFNGVSKHTDFPNFTEASYKQSKALSSVPITGITLTTNQRFWLNYFNDGVAANVYFENDAGDKAHTALTTATFNQVSVGSGNMGSLVLDAGTLPIIKANTKWYTVQYESGQKIRFDISRRCEISNYEIAFVDRLGSIGTFRFNLRSYERGIVNNEAYKQHINGSITGSKWGYTNQEVGEVLINPKQTKTLELNTDWMTEEMSNYFAEFIASPVKYITIDGFPLPCIVETLDFELDKKRNKKLIRKSVVVRLSNQDKING